MLNARHTSYHKRDFVIAICLVFYNHIPVDTGRCHLPAKTGIWCTNKYKFGRDWWRSLFPIPYTKFYYDKWSDACRPFRYRGCGGNRNKFENVTECRQRCRVYIPDWVTPPNRGPTWRPPTTTTRYPPWVTHRPPTTRQYPPWRTTTWYPPWMTHRPPTTRRYPPWRTTTWYPPWMTHRPPTTRRYPPWRTTTRYPPWMTHRPPTTRRYPPWRTTTRYPPWMTHRPPTTRRYPPWRTTTRYPPWRPTTTASTIS